MLRDVENDRKELLRIRGDSVSDIRFKCLILRALPPAIDHIEQQQRPSPRIGLEDIKAALSVTYRDWLSRDGCPPCVAGPGTAMWADAANVVIGANSTGTWGGIDLKGGAQLKRKSHQDRKFAMGIEDTVHIMSSVVTPQQSTGI